MNPTDISTIERQVFIQAPRTSVWRFLATASRFGEWFGVSVEGEFAPGARVRMTHPKAGFSWHVTIESMVPESFFSWRWEASIWKSGQPPMPISGPPTLVEFRLEEADGGTRLTVVESGLEHLDQEFRLAFFEQNGKGWTVQTQALAKYAAEHAGQHA